MDDDEIWETAKKPISELVDAVKEMGLNVNRLIEFYSKHLQSDNNPEDTKTSETLSPLARAKLELAIVFAMNASYWVYLVTHGEDPNGKKIAKDLNRIRLFMDRAREVEESVHGPNPSVKRPRIDKDASKRLVGAYMQT